MFNRTIRVFKRNNRQVTIVTIHNYGKIYEVEGNVSFQHLGGER